MLIDNIYLDGLGRGVSIVSAAFPPTTAGHEMGLWGLNLHAAGNPVQTTN